MRQFYKKKKKKASSRPDVKHIYFYIPTPKLKLRRLVTEFVEKHSNDNDFTGKFNILSDENLDHILRKKSKGELQNTVLLMDEFY